MRCHQVQRIRSGQLWIVKCGTLKVRNENKIFKVNRRVSEPAVRHALGVITGYADKSLPEDEELVLEDIPGLNLPPPSTSPQGSTPSAFSFIELEVHTNLAHMSAAVREGVIQRLRTYEPTVFETRKLPRLAPRRGLDMDITEYSGA